MSTHEPPPPPPPGGYGPPPGGYSPPHGASRWDLGAALAYGWAKFQANAAQIVVAALVLLVGLGVVGAVTAALQAGLLDSGGVEYVDGTPTIREGSGLLARLLVAGLSSALFLIVAQVIGAGIIRGALGITEGRDFRMDDLFRVERLGPVIVTSLIIGAATFVGTLLCYLPGLVVGFLTSYSLYFVIDKGLAPIEAITASFMLVKDNIATTLVWYIVGGLVAVAGVIACFVGLIVTIPIVLIGTAYTYKILTDQPVAP